MEAPAFPRFNVLGVGVSALSLDEACAFLLASPARPTPAYVCCCTAHGLVESLDDPDLRSAYNHAAIATPDGMPLVWIGRTRGRRGITRVYGPDLMDTACDRGRAAGIRHYFYGGAPGVAEKMVRRLVLKYPGLVVAGAGTAPFRPMHEEEKAAAAQSFERSGSDLVWVGLGAPRQELFMADLARRMGRGSLVGVGAAFDFATGRVHQAPRWIQHSGFEWAYRLCHEPRRLGRRYLATTPRFAACALAQLVGLRRYPEPGERGDA